MRLLSLILLCVCVLTRLHLALIGKCDSDFMHSHKNKISAMLCYSLQGETGGYNRKHMWAVTVCSVRARCIAIRPSTNTAHKHTHALMHAVNAV